MTASLRLRQLRAILTLPLMAAGVVPALLLWRSRAEWPVALPAPARGALALAGLVLAGAGLAGMVVTIGLFSSEGEGTLAPWDPTRRLVVRGPYRRVRNPMISSVMALLLGEAALFASPALLGWFFLFVAVNAVWIPLVEEPGLERRFGEEYREYRRRVPRWIPRWPRDPPVSV